MEMPVAIDVVERKTGGVKRFKLGGDFVGELLPRAQSITRLIPEKTTFCRKRPDRSTSSPMVSAGIAGTPSTSTRCRPTRSDGMRRARSTASAAAGAVTIRLAAVRMPRRCACSTASLTSGAAPKSSAVTIRFLMVGSPGPVFACGGFAFWVD